MPFSVPNQPDAAFADQAELDSRDLEILAAGESATGVITGCAVTAQGTPNMTVAVSAGLISVDTDITPVVAGNVTIATADATNPRFDLITIDSLGAKEAVTGTASTNPVFPVIPAYRVVVAAVYVPAADTAINANQIIDKRVSIPYPDVRRMYHETLRHWHSAYAGREQKAANVMFHGDSVTNGGFATTKNNTFTRLAGDAIQRLYRGGGLGFIPAGSYMSEWSWGAGATSYVGQLGLGMGAYLMTELAHAGNITVNTDRAWIMLSGGTGGGTAQILIDDVPHGTINTYNATNKHFKYDTGVIPEGVNGKQHKITVRPNASGQIVVVSGIMVFDGDHSRGVRFWESGWSGSTTANWNSASLDHWLGVGPEFASPDLVVIQLGLNDQGVYYVPPADYKTHLSGIVDLYNTNTHANPSILLLGIWARGDVHIDSTSATTTSGSPVVTFASGSIDAGSPGSLYEGTDFPAGTKILSRQSGTQVTMTANATVSGSNRAFRARYIEEQWEPYRRAMRELARERSLEFFDLNDLSGWMGKQGDSQAHDVTITSGSAVITSSQSYFRNAAGLDTGMGIQGPGIPNGTTIASIQSGTQATMSANATASSTGATVTYTNRRDPGLLTADLLHPSDRGMQWIADQLQQRLLGIGKFGPIPAGILDAKGQMVVAEAADTPRALRAGQEGQALTYSPGSTLGVLPAGPSALARSLQYIATPNASTAVNLGFSAVPTINGTASVGDQVFGPFINYASGAVSGNAAGPFWAAQWQGRWLPELTVVARTAAAGDLSNARYWFGLVSASPTGSDDPVASGAGFRYSTGTGQADATAFWRCWSNDNSGGGLVTVTNVAISAATRYMFRIEFIGTLGTSVTEVRFYINNILVARHTTNLPVAATTHSIYSTVTTTAALAKNLQISRIALNIPG